MIDSSSMYATHLAPARRNPLRKTPAIVASLIHGAMVRVVLSIDCIFCLEMRGGVRATAAGAASTSASHE